MTLICATWFETQGVCTNRWYHIEISRRCLMNLISRSYCYILYIVPQIHLHRFYNKILSIDKISLNLSWIHCLTCNITRKPTELLGSPGRLSRKSDIALQNYCLMTVLSVVISCSFCENSSKRIKNMVREWKHKIPSFRSQVQQTCLFYLLLIWTSYINIIWFSGNTTQIEHNLLQIGYLQMFYSVLCILLYTAWFVIF